LARFLRNTPTLHCTNFHLQRKVYIPVIMPSPIDSNINGVFSPKVTRYTTLSKKSQLTLLSDKAKAAAKEEAAAKEKNAEEEKKKKQEEAERREQRAAERQKKQEDKKKNDEKTPDSMDYEEMKEHEDGKKTNQHLMELNNTDEEFDFTMDVEDTFDPSQDTASSNLFGGENTNKEILVNSPEYKRGKATGGGVLKGSHRYSNNAPKSNRKVASSKPSTFQYSKFVEIGMLLETEDKATECIMNLKYLMINGQYIAKVALMELSPKDAHNPSTINKPTDIPSNFTLLGKFLKMSTEDPFKKRQLWSNKKDGHNNNRDEEDEKVYAKAVYGTIRITASIPIEELVPAVQMEWQAKGGLKLVIKDIQAPESKFVATIFFQSILVSPTTVQTTFTNFLQKAKAIEEERGSHMWEGPTDWQIQVQQNCKSP